MRQCIDCEHLGPSRLCIRPDPVTGLSRNGDATAERGSETTRRVIGDKIVRVRACGPRGEFWERRRRWWERLMGLPLVRVVVKRLVR
jgi:hypothetical protein